MNHRILIFLILGIVCNGYSQTKTNDIKICKDATITIGELCPEKNTGCPTQGITWKEVTNGNNNPVANDNQATLTVRKVQNYVEYEKSDPFCKTPNDKIKYRITPVIVDSVIFKEPFENSWEWGYDDWQNFGNTNGKATEKEGRIIELSIEKGKSDTISAHIFTNPLNTSPECITFESESKNDQFAITPYRADNNDFKFIIKSNHDIADPSFEEKSYKIWAKCENLHAKNNKVKSKLHITAYKKAEIDLVFVEVSQINQPRTGALTLSYSNLNIDDYKKVIDSFNLNTFNQSIMKFNYADTIKINVDYDLDNNGNLNYANNSEENKILSAIQASPKYTNLDKTIFVILVPNITEGVYGYAKVSTKTNFKSNYTFIRAGGFSQTKQVFPNNYIGYWSYFVIGHELGHVLGLDHANKITKIIFNFYGTSACGAEGGSQNFEDPKNLMDYCPMCQFSLIDPRSCHDSYEKIRKFQWNILHDILKKHYINTY